MSRFTAQLFKHLHAPISSSGRRRRRKRPTIHSLLSRLRTPSRTAPNWFHAVVNKIRVHLDSVSKKRKQRFFGVKSGNKSYRSYFVETFVNIIRNKNITIWFVNIPETYFEVFQPIIEKDYIYDWFENKRFDSFYFEATTFRINRNLNSIGYRKIDPRVSKLKSRILYGNAFAFGTRQGKNEAMICVPWYKFFTLQRQ